MKPEVNKVKRSIKVWSESHSQRDENLFIQILRGHGISDGDIIVILETLSNICTHCYDDTDKCNCWNDE